MRAILLILFVTGTMLLQADKLTDSMWNFSLQTPQGWKYKWSYYSKYTESHVYLYPDGSYEDNSSSSYGNSDASVGTTWGAASDSQSRGHWRAQGNAERGEIIFTLPNGKTSVYPYRVHKENNHIYWSEYYFGDRLYARSPLR